MTKHQWHDPWPSPQVAWADPPWQLSGRVVTAWFGAPRTLVEQVMSPSLWPDDPSTVRARLRFYDIVFTSLADVPASPTIPVEGRFREAVIAFQARAGDVKGEASLFMWTDSDAYMTWGREVFGWPLLRGRIELSGSLWDGQVRPGAGGTATLSSPTGSAELMIDEVREEVGGSAAGSPWLTPRRVLCRAGLGNETRELLVVRPTVRDPGVRYTAAGRAALVFDSAHPLHGLHIHNADYEVVDNITLVVGSDVEVL